MLKLVGKHAGVHAESSAADNGESITKLRELIALTTARHPQVKIGVTGMPVLEYDEMQTSQRDMTWTSSLSMLGVAACFWAAFGGWRHSAIGDGCVGNLDVLGIWICDADGWSFESVERVVCFGLDWARGRFWRALRRRIFEDSPAER